MWKKSSRFNTNMPRKNDFTLGLETILNNPATSFLTQPKVFTEIHGQSKMPLSHMIRAIGKGAKNRKKPSEPTDEEKSKARLDKMEASSEAK